MIPEKLAEEIENFEEDKKKAIYSYKKDGKYLVIAGPGTGKTFTISKRIEAILSDDEYGTSAERILCLTFSDAAAKEMRRKLEKENVKDAAGVNIYTFHSFCMSLMEEYSELFDVKNKVLISPIRKQAIVKDCLDELESEGEKERIKLFRESNNLYAKIDDIVKGIEAVKHNRYNADKVKYNLEHNIAWKPLLKEIEDETEKQKHNDKIEEINELLRIYERYIQKTADYIDFDDMINYVLYKFEQNPKFLDNIAKQYDFIMVDEYQDTNKSQNEIVFNLAKHCKNILVVGDDDQIIYSFQGASLDTIQNFKKTFEKDVTVLCLKENRRSTKTILKVAEELAKLQDEYPKKKNLKDVNYKLRFMEKKLTACNKDLEQKDKAVKIYEFNNEKQELQYITNEINKIINDKNQCPVDKNGKKLFSEIAILTKTNQDAYNYANQLKSMGIRVQLTGGKNIFEINSVKVLVSYLQFIANPEQNSDKLYKYLLYKPFHIHPKDYAVLHSKEIKDISGSSLIRRMEQAINVSDNENKKEYKNPKKILAERGKLQNFIDTYKILQDYIACESVKNSIIQIANKTGILKCYLTIEINRTENYEAVNRILEEAETYKNNYIASGNITAFKEFVSYLNTLIDGDIKVLTDKTEKPYNAVQVSTLHSSKGREFEYVFMPRLNSKKFESNSKDDCKEIIPLDNDDIQTPFENLSTIEKIKDKSSQMKFLNSAKLLYVGMTRAKHSLVMSYPRISKNPPSWFISNLMENIKQIEEKSGEKIIDYENKSDWIDDGSSSFIYDNKLISAIETVKDFKQYIKSENQDDFEKAVENIRNIIGITAAPNEAIKYDYDYKEEFVEDYIVDNIPDHYSVSSLNTYLKCPKQFLYQYILHLPHEDNSDENEDDFKGNPNYAEWGIVIHYALENYVKEVITKKEHQSFDIMKKYFYEKQKEILDNVNENTVKEKEAALEKYYQELFKIDAKNFSEVEKKVPSKEEDGIEYIEIEGIKFSGTIDRIDKENDNDGKDIYSIYDYKTGINKSKVKDETKPNGKYEKIYNQLAFYKYVLQTKYNMTVKKAGIIFPEEPESSFDVEDLKDDIGFQNCKLVIDKYKKAVKEDIEKEHNFDRNPKCKCDEYTFCDFKDFCKSMVI